MRKSKAVLRMERLEKDIQRVVAKGLKLRTGSYLVRGDQCACAIGCAVVQAVARKSKKGLAATVERVWQDMLESSHRARPSNKAWYDYAAKLVNYGVTPQDLVDLEAGFEGTDSFTPEGVNVHFSSPFYELGCRLREQADNVDDRTL